MNASKHSPLTSSHEEHFHEAVHHAAHLLPAQGPLGLFVHHNTLHAFEHLPFHEALRQAADRMNAQVYLPPAVYREAWRHGRIRSSDLQLAIERFPQFMPPTPEPISGLDQLLLLHEPETRTDDELRWLMRERTSALTLHEDLSPQQRRLLLERGVAFLLSILEQARTPPQADAALQRLLPAAWTEPGTLLRWADALPQLFFLPADIDSLRALCDRAPETVVERLYLGLATAALKSAPTPSVAAPAPGTLNAAVRRRTGIDPLDITRSWLVRFAAAYLDEGIASWSAMDRTRGPWAAFQQYVRWTVVREHWFPEQTCVPETADAAASALLTDLCPDPSGWSTYLEAMLQELAGWGGMMNRLETNPGDRDPDAPPASIAEWAAIRLVTDQWAAQWVLSEQGVQQTCAALFQQSVTNRPATAPALTLWSAARLAHLLQLAGWSLEDVSQANVSVLHRVALRDTEWPVWQRQAIWQEAWEGRYAAAFVAALMANRPRQAQNRPAQRPSVQAVFCIDDREESLRRAFEELDFAHETAGAAGFFGIAMDYTGLTSDRSVALCPPVLTPAHAVLEHPLAGSMDAAELAAVRKKWLHRTVRAGRQSANGLVGAVFMPVLGAASAVPLFARVFAPRLHAAVEQKLTHWFAPPPSTRLVTSREHQLEQVLDPGVRAAGFTVEEQADRVERLLRQMGFTRFAPLVVLVGHGAHTTNNPHAAAYNCGACGGRRGGPNARAFSAMANNEAVRDLLADRGLPIPNDTWFIGCEHDTCTDTFTWYDTDLVPQSHHERLTALTHQMNRAAAMNARERCRRFASAPRRLDDSGALTHVGNRAEDPGQARPELGHMTNAACVVGRRELTRRLFLDRRSFLVSYDSATDDEDGRILESILAAAGPVCAGINLEYYFSCVDNQRFGAGTKLPHNLTSLLGVMDGAGSDLRTGLPRQMIEAHEPMRLLLVVETSTAVMDRILQRHAGLRSLVGNRWMRTFVIDPLDGPSFEYVADRGFVAVTFDNDAPPGPVPDSVACYCGHSGFVEPTLLSNPTGGAA